jgi:hypothetical protein
VFTARYALSPYIKQIRFVFKGLNLVVYEVATELLKELSGDALDRVQAVGVVERGWMGGHTHIFSCRIHIS